jgi:hypothetical protein
MLAEKFNGTGIDVHYMFGYAVIITQDPAQFLEYKKNLEHAIASRKSIHSMIIGDRRHFLPGRKVFLDGFITDKETGDRLRSVDVFVNDRKLAVTDGDGKFSLPLNGIEFVLSFHAAGFEEKIFDLQIFESGSMSVALENRPTILDELVFTDDKVSSRQMGQTNLKLQEIKRAPALLGEADVIRQIQQQPGVTTVGEISNGFNVRGGGVDQNLVLYDGIPVFNTAHALGFFSAFNAYSIQQASFYRGGIPVEFGGRVSSVLDIVSTEGTERWHGSGGIGLLSSYASVSGPIKKDTTTMMASFRASYSDWIINTLKSDYANLRNSSLSFYDGSLKLSHSFNSKTKIIFSGYMSSDRFALTTDTSFSYQNTTASISLRHALSEKLYMQVRVGFGNYRYNVHEPERSNAADLEYGITYPSVQLNFNVEGKHKLAFGLQSTYYRFKPGTIKPASGSSTVERMEIPEELSLENALYAGDEFSLTDKLTVRGGLRLSSYRRMGKGKVYKYDPEHPRERKYIVDSVEYGAGEKMKDYFGLEPRLSFSYLVHPDGIMKFGYNRMYQYLHLISNTAAVTPVDIWQSSNAYFKPQIADQISFGYYRELRTNTVEVFAEVFYKSVRNVLDFKDGSTLILNPTLETELLPGRAVSYGLEVSGIKKQGRFQGSLSYTWSRSFRKVKGRYKSEQINDGEFYRSNYDQPHMVNLSWRYGISKRYHFTGNFTYHTGRPMSVPLSAYSVDGVTVLNFSDRNAHRIPDYHRLDLAFVMEGNHKRKKILDGTFTFSFYNVYNRRNAYSVFYQDDGKGNIKPYKLSVIGSIIPSLHYGFKF